MIPVCPRTGKRIRSKRNRCWLIWLLPLTGFFSLLWFLVRVIPKPSRAVYPCQRVAFPLASGFIVWLAGIIGSFVLFHKAKQFLRKSRWALAEICLAVALITAWFCFVYTPAEPVLADSPVPNVPVGVAKGIYPGRVVWVHDPNATSWDGNTAGSTTSHEIYVMKTGTNWKFNSSWVEVGGGDIPPDLDTEVTGTITSNISDYIDADTGLITWGVYQANNSSNVMRINYIQMKVRFMGAGVDLNDDDYVDLLDFAVFAGNWLACQPYQ